MDSQNPSAKRFQQTQAQVNEVVDIMRMNVDRVLERDAKLSHLDNRADALQLGASQFEQSSGSLKRKMAWKNIKMWIILGIVVSLLLVGIIVWIVAQVKPDTMKIIPYTQPPISPTNPPKAN